LIRIAAALCALIAAVALSGCESLNTTWDTTWASGKSYYKEYVNPDPEVDLKALDYTSTEEKLGKLFTPVNKPVADLCRYLNKEDNFPGERWVAGLEKGFPWISGLTIVTLKGEIIVSTPAVPLKPLNLQPLLDHGDALRDRKLRVFVDPTPLGPEVYIGTAMFKGNDLVGLIVVHFDPRSVIDFCPAPQDLVVLTPETVLWSGSNAALGEALVKRPWAEMLTEDVSGTVDENGTEYAWMTSYMGDRQLVYLTEVAPDREDDDSSFLWFF